MKIRILFLSLLLISRPGFGQQLKTNTPVVDSAFSLALNTLAKNTQNNLIRAGGAYGGEWVRDCAINTWNAINLLNPTAAQFSLWSVTTDNRSLVGNEYWDKIIWVVGAYNYYLINDDRDFLKQAYACSANTMKELEHSTFDKQYGLFMGPSVFNDGIAGYEEPVYDPSGVSSFVLDFPGSKTIKCLSTNCVYYQAYVLLARMADILGDRDKMEDYTQKAETLKANIRLHFLDPHKVWLNYFIDGNGGVHPQQEGLGISFAILFGVVTPDEARKLISQVYVSPHGLPDIYPPFKRYSEKQPGRHNNVIWPFVNAFWAEACLKSGRGDIFRNELTNLADLAVNKGQNDFREIYNEETGEPDGGWQCGGHTESCHNQTWSATGYLRMVFWGLFGMHFSAEGMGLSPDFKDLRSLGFSELDGLPYQHGILNIKFTGKGLKPSAILIDGKKVDRALIRNGHTGTTTIEYVF